MWGPIFTDGQSAKCSQSNFTDVHHHTHYTLYNYCAYFTASRLPAKIGPLKNFLLYSKNDRNHGFVHNY